MMIRIECMVRRVQFRWAGSVVCMGENRIAKDLFYDELVKGDRNQSDQKKRFKDCFKYIRKKSNLNTESRETVR